MDNSGLHCTDMTYRPTGTYVARFRDLCADGRGLYKTAEPIVMPFEGQIGYLWGQDCAGQHAGPVHGAT